MHKEGMGACKSKLALATRESVGFNSCRVLTCRQQGLPTVECGTQYPYIPPEGS